MQLCMLHLLHARKNPTTFQIQEDFAFKTYSDCSSGGPNWQGATFLQAVTDIAADDWTGYTKLWDPGCSEIIVMGDTSLVSVSQRQTAMARSNRKCKLSPRRNYLGAGNRCSAECGVNAPHFSWFKLALNKLFASTLPHKSVLLRSWAPLSQWWLYQSWQLTVEYYEV